MGAGPHGGVVGGVGYGRAGDGGWPFAGDEEDGCAAGEGGGGEGLLEFDGAGEADYAGAEA